MQSSEPNSAWSLQPLTYQLTLKRAQIAETRLMVALWQRRSQKVRRVLQAIKYLQMLSLYRARPRYDVSPGLRAQKHSRSTFR
ncbi:MAG: hypothetical protein WBB01_21170 [Phormidesmis sp.]